VSGSSSSRRGRQRGLLWNRSHDKSEFDVLGLDYVSAQRPVEQRLVTLLLLLGFCKQLQLI